MNTHNKVVNSRHKFHLVDPSPWPILTSVSLLFLAVGLVLFVHQYKSGTYILSLSLLALLSTLFFWWKDIITEGITGNHSSAVQNGLKIGMLIFLLSEIALFGSFFASYFFASINPVENFDIYGEWIQNLGTWPPKHIKTFNPWDIPFMNTLILLLSGTSVTWANYAIEVKDQKSTSKALLITVILGFVFSFFQLYEYYHAKFSLVDGIYASNFYIATGFHGVHVFIGSIFLLVCYFRSKRGDFIKGNHLGMEFAAWYWHFVDVVWLFLFLFIYILGR